MTKRQERLQKVREFLQSFAALERTNTDEAGWIALKFSCTQAEAQKLIAAATKESTIEEETPSAQREESR